MENPTYELTLRRPVDGTQVTYQTDIDGDSKLEALTEMLEENGYTILDTKDLRDHSTPT